MKSLVLLFSSLAAISHIHLSEGVRSPGKKSAIGFRDDGDHSSLEGVYSTPLDHFSSTNNIRLSLKYKLNAEYFQVGGPLFLYTELNTDLSREMNRYSLLEDLARKLNGALIQADARYCQTNYFKDTKFQKEKKYFTVDHILGDIPYLLGEVKARLNSSSSRVVTYGYEDGGAIAVLARKRFPHIVDAAWSSSGIFRSSMSETEPYEDVAKQIYTYGGANCTAALAKAFQQLKQLVDSKNIDKLRKVLGLLPDDIIDLDDEQHVQFIYKEVLHLTGIYQEKSSTIKAIKEWCSGMTSGADVLESAKFYIPWGYQTHLELIRLFEFLEASEFFYCNQVASNRLVTSKNSFQNVFPNIVTESYYDRRCTDLFGTRYNRTLLEQNSKQFNLQHGGGAQFVSNVVFSEGNMNWRRFSGVSEFNPNTSKLVTNQFEGPAKDLTQIFVDDSKELVAAKELIVETLSSYIKPAEG